MVKGSSATHTFTLPSEMTSSGLQKVEVFYSQHGEILLVKRESDCYLDGNKLTVPLKQEDTLSFQPSGGLADLKIQIRIKTNTGKVLVSNMIYDRVEPSIVEGTI